jgi:hypothetical protein
MELAQALINYLATQPYQSVYILIGELTKQANVKPEEEPKKD